jgi:hypothetical protein
VMYGKEFPAGTDRAAIELWCFAHAKTGEATYRRGEAVQPALGCSATDVIAEATPVPVKPASADAQPAEVFNPPWEEPRESAVIFKCRRGRRG